ncbi:hypothetical protein IG631_06337 [Alternaria alternata]|nr:hypothetical protein IG631_06337 [Alternaria alternata]
MREWRCQASQMLFVGDYLVLTQELSWRQLLARSEATARGKRPAPWPPCLAHQRASTSLVNRRLSQNKALLYLSKTFTTHCITYQDATSGACCSQLCSYSSLSQSALR